MYCLNLVSKMIVLYFCLCMKICLIPLCCHLYHHKPIECVDCTTLYKTIVQFGHVKPIIVIRTYLKSSHNASNTYFPYIPAQYSIFTYFFAKKLWQFDIAQNMSQSNRWQLIVAAAAFIILWTLFTSDFFPSKSYYREEPVLLDVHDAIPQLGALYADGELARELSQDFQHKQQKDQPQKTTVTTTMTPVRVPGAEPLNLIVVTAASDATFCFSRALLIALHDDTLLKSHGMNIRVMIYDAGLSPSNLVVLKQLYASLFSLMEWLDTASLPEFWKIPPPQPTNPSLKLNVSQDVTWWWPIGVLKDAFSLDPTKPHRHVAGSDVVIWIHPNHAMIPLETDTALRKAAEEKLKLYLIHVADEAKLNGVYSPIARPGDVVSSVVSPTFLSASGAALTGPLYPAAQKPLSTIGNAMLCNPHLVAIAVTDQTARDVLNAWNVCSSIPGCVIPDQTYGLTDPEAVLAMVMSRQNKTCGATKKADWEPRWDEQRNLEKDRATLDAKCAQVILSFEHGLGGIAAGTAGVKTEPQSEIGISP